MAAVVADADLALALQLQAQFDAEYSLNHSIGHISSDEDNDITMVAMQPCLQRQTVEPPGARSEISLIDPSWDLIDPNPDARALFMEFNDKYFWGKLSGVEVRWSPRMTSCAGVCQYEGKGGLCSVRLSEPLLKLRPRKDLVETLLHEMIHAYLFVTNNNKDRDDHGPIFHSHMHRINKATGAHITVYHSFHDEVANYQQHWWRCDGVCRARKPYFGYVKRAMNRAPSHNDKWWSDHVRDCGGTFIKIKEPEGFGEKKSKKSKSNEKLPINGLKKLTDWLPLDKSRASMTPVTKKPIWIEIESEKKTNQKPLSSLTNQISSNFPDDDMSDSELVSAVDSITWDADEDVFDGVHSPLKKKLKGATSMDFDRTAPVTPNGLPNAKISSFSGATTGQSHVLASRSNDQSIPTTRRLPGYGEIPLRIGSQTTEKSLDSTFTTKSRLPIETKSSNLLSFVNTDSKKSVTSPAGSRFLAKAMATASQFVGSSPREGDLCKTERSSGDSNNSIIVGDEQNTSEGRRIIPTEKPKRGVSAENNNCRKRTASTSLKSSDTGARPGIQQILREANCPVGGIIRIPGFVSVGNPNWRKLKGNMNTTLPSPTRSPNSTPGKLPFKRPRFTSNECPGSAAAASEEHETSSVKSVNHREVIQILDNSDIHKSASDTRVNYRLDSEASTSVTNNDRRNVVNPSNVVDAFESMNVSGTVSCPVCTLSIPAWSVNEHLDNCLY